jgi:hypothetical protein
LITRVTLFILAVRAPGRMCPISLLPTSKVHVPEKSGLPKAKADTEKTKVMNMMKTAARFIEPPGPKRLRNITDGNIHVNRSSGLSRLTPFTLSPLPFKPECRKTTGAAQQTDEGGHPLLPPWLRLLRIGHEPFIRSYDTLLL